MLITKFQESPGGENVISHLLPPALTMRSDSVSFTVTCSSGCWWLDSTRCMTRALDSLLCLPAEGQAAADAGMVTVGGMLCWQFSQDNFVCHLSHIYMEYMLRSPCVYYIAVEHCKLKMVQNPFTKENVMGKCQEIQKT